MEPGEVEPPSRDSFPGKYGPNEKSAPKCAPIETDPDLAAVVEAWPDLSEPVRLAMLALVRSRC